MDPLRRVDVSGASIAFADSGGSGPLIVLIHGNSSSSAAWSQQLGGALRRRWRLLALELPGCGESARLPTYSFATMRDAIAGFAREADCQDAVFVGHSLGGHLLLEAAGLLPRARGFVVMGTPPLGKPPEMDRAFRPVSSLASAFKAELTAQEIEEWARVMFAPGSAVPPEIARDIRRTDPRLRSDLAAVVGALGYADEVEIVRSLKQPLAVLHGEADALVDGGYIESLPMPTLWRGAVQHIEGAGHYAQLERPEAFDALLDAFAESCV